MEPLLPDFSFAFQPIINVETASIVSFEALVRGIDNSSASQIFKQVHEGNKYYFDEVLRLKAIPLAARLGIGCNLNLNLLPGSLEVSKSAISSTLEMAENSGIPIDKITIEITESEIIHNVGWFIEAINIYRSSGVRFAIDDFGAGYSGLNLLADFQPDSIKIDMSLVRNIHNHGPRQAIVRGIIRTCQDLGIDIIAEGVENNEEYEWCHEEEINLFQGYFLGKPAFEELPVAFFPNNHD
jgi:EAL domain-containing protein (putative c-di-GMP-specific phosphodiesterase class I)